MRSGPASRGFTLIETMVVVAIIGILSAVAGVEIITTLRSTRVTAMGKTLEGVLVAARTRAMVTRCPHFVQINGKNYAGTGPVGYEIRKGVASIFRKGGCSTTQPWFVTGDVRVDSTQLAVDGLSGDLVLGVDPSVLGDEEIDTEAVVISFQPTGDRQVAVDASGGGAAGYAVAAGVPVNMLLPHRKNAAVTDGLAYRVVAVPLSNAVPRLLQ